MKAAPAGPEVLAQNGARAERAPLVRVLPCRSRTQHARAREHRRWRRTRAAACARTRRSTVRAERNRARARQVLHPSSPEGGSAPARTLETEVFDAQGPAWGLRQGAVSAEGTKRSPLGVPGRASQCRRMPWRQAERGLPSLKRMRIAAIHLGQRPTPAAHITCRRSYNLISI